MDSYAATSFGVRRQLSSARIIIVSGPPGSGKTTIANRIAHDLKIAILSKDTIKEQLFNSLGYDDRKRSKRLGQASFDMLLRIGKSIVELNVPVILESAFRQSDGPHLVETLGSTNYLQVYCDAEEITCLGRFRNRVISGQRHPGHADSEGESDLLGYFERGLFGVLDLPGKLVRIDTNNYSSLSYEQGYCDVINTYAEQGG